MTSRKTPDKGVRPPDTDERGGPLAEAEIEQYLVAAQNALQQQADKKRKMTPAAIARAIDGIRYFFTSAVPETVRYPSVLPEEGRRYSIVHAAELSAFCNDEYDKMILTPKAENVSKAEILTGAEYNFLRFFASINGMNIQINFSGITLENIVIEKNPDTDYLDLHFDQKMQEILAKLKITLRKKDVNGSK